MKRIEIRTDTPPLTEDEEYLFGSVDARDRYHHLAKFGARAYRVRYPGRERDPESEPKEEERFRKKLRAEFEKSDTPKDMGRLTLSDNGDVIQLMPNEHISEDESELQDIA